MVFLCATVLSIAASGGGGGSLPDNRVIQYTVHNTPGEPASGEKFSIWLEISANSQINDTIMWNIDRVTVELAATSEAWSEDGPFVDTTNGRWQVDHPDADNISQSDFAVPPPVIDRLANHDINGDDLDVDVEGFAYTPPPGGAPYTITASVSYSLTRVGETEPDEEGEVEDSDVPTPPDSPPSAAQ